MKNNSSRPRVLFSSAVHRSDLILGLGAADLISTLTSRGFSGHWGQVPDAPELAAVQVLITLLSSAACLQLARDARLTLEARGVPLPLWLGGKR